MSWIEKSGELFSRTASRTSNTASPETSPKNENSLNLTLYGASLPLRRTRTIIHRAKTRTLRTLSLVPGIGVSGGAAHLLAENTTLDLGFTTQLDSPPPPVATSPLPPPSPAPPENNLTLHPYLPIGESSSSARSSPYNMQHRRRDSDSSEVFESDGYTSHSVDCSSIESSPAFTPVDNNNLNNFPSQIHFSRSSSWATDEQSVRSECDSITRSFDDTNENKGEWNNFWKTYNNPHGFEFKKKTVDDDDLKSIKSNSSKGKKLPEKKSPQIQKVIMSTADAIEAATCARRLSEILSMAIRRSSLPCTTRNQQDLMNLKKKATGVEKSIPNPPPLPEYEQNMHRSKSESQLSGMKINATDLQNQRNSLKPLNADDCVEFEIQASDQFNIATILKKVIEQRRDVIMPSADDNSGCVSHRSDWSSFD